MVENTKIRQQADHIKDVDAKLDRLGQKIDAADKRAKEALHPHSRLIDVTPLEPEVPAKEPRSSGNGAASAP